MRARWFATTGVGDLDRVLRGGYPCGAISLVHTGDEFREGGFRELIACAVEADDERCVLVNNRPTPATLQANLRAAPELLIVNGWVEGDRFEAAVAVKTLEQLQPCFAPRTAVVVLTQTPCVYLKCAATMTIEVQQRNAFPLLICNLWHEEVTEELLLCL